MEHQGEEIKVDKKDAGESQQAAQKSENFTTRILRNIPRCWRNFKSDVDTMSSDSDSSEIVNTKTSMEKLNYEKFACLPAGQSESPAPTLVSSDSSNFENAKISRERLDYDKYACLQRRISAPTLESPALKHLARDTSGTDRDEIPPEKLEYDKYACLQRRMSAPHSESPALTRSYRSNSSTSSTFSRRSMYSTQSTYSTCCSAHLKHYRSCQTIPRQPYGATARRQTLDRDRGDTRQQFMVNRRPHSVDLGRLERNRNPWLFVVPCKRNRHKQCDELPDEFRRAGIGVCFEGISIK